MIRLIYNNKAFRILNNFSVKSNNSEVTFNDITIDFTDYTLADMPLKYQEVQIKECEDDLDVLEYGKVLFFGYVDTIKVGKMQMSDEKRELTITLLSPLKLATVRTTTAKGTYQVSDLVPLILEPLLNDGYKIAEMNIADSQITVNYIMQTIEYCMNDLGSKKDIFWTIDQNKNIYVNSLEYLFEKEVKKKITKTSEETGLLKIEPQIQATDYANVINIKNARLLNGVISQGSTSSEFEYLSLPKTIKTEDVIEFNYPITISLEYLRKIANDSGFKEQGVVEFPVIYLSINNTTYSITYNINTDSLVYTGNFTFSDDNGAEGTIVLQRDTFFNNLITGFKWNGENNAVITYCSTESALRYTKVKFMNIQEIEKLKGVISETGQIEKTVDANGIWFTNKSLIEYARSLLTQNTNNINTIVLEYDNNYDFNLGDLVEIKLPKFYCEGLYAITQIRYVYNSKSVQKWEITIKNSNLMSSYIDMFRPKADNVDDEKQESLLLSEYITEGINEVHNVTSEETNSLNAVLNINL